MDFLPAELVENRFRRQLQGREHIVAPLVLIKPGVLNGSQGPLLYTAEDIKASLFAWNDIVQVVDHPGGTRSPESARTPANLDKYGVGRVMNAKVDNQGRLVAEGWFDVENLRRIDAGLLSTIESGRKVEVSTGLVTTNELTPGRTTDGVDYIGIARNLQPDHLAIGMNGATGACSVAAGCGVNVNQQHKGESQMGLNETERKGLMDSLVGGCCWDEVDRPTLNELTDDQIQRFVKNADRHDKLLAFSAASEFTDEAGSVHTWNADDKLWTSTIKPPEPTEEVVTNALTPVQEADLAFAATVRQERLDADIAKITANESNQLTAQQIADMPPATRQAVVNSLPEKPNANYSGQAGAPPTKTLNQDDFPEFNLPCDRPAEPVAA